MSSTVAFRFSTDTATLAIFDPARLQHRLADAADWWTIPSDEVSAINRGNMLSVSTGSDGCYDTEVLVGDDTADGAFIEVLIACQSGRFFVGPGELIPSDGLTTSDEFGGRFLALPVGTYRVRVSRPSTWSLRVSLLPSDSPAQNHLNGSPKLKEAV